jgi:hypothetical protein
VLRGERGEFHIGDPLGPGHEPVEPRDQHPNREPCSIGSGSPFIPITSIACLAGSVSVAVGVPQVDPSTLVVNTWSAPRRTPSFFRTSASSTPVK